MHQQAGSAVMTIHRSFDRSVPMSMWAADHWSMLRYLAHCIADGKPVDSYKFRNNSDERPNRACFLHQWKASFSTRTQCGMIAGHDDWDVLNDLDREGLIIIVDLDKLIIVMTEPGIELARRLIEHRLQGGWLNDFHVGVLR